LSEVLWLIEAEDLLFARFAQTVHQFHAGRRKAGVQQPAVRGLSAGD